MNDDDGSFEHGNTGLDTGMKSYLMDSDSDLDDTPQLASRRQQSDPQTPTPAGQSRRSNSALSAGTLDSDMNSMYRNDKAPSRDFNA
ncbi:hypothetical protein FBU59_005424, partial [Linderina macrospora]